MNGTVPETLFWLYPFPGDSGAKRVRKYPKSAESETTNDRAGRDVFKTGEYIKGVYQVYSGGKCVQKWKFWQILYGISANTLTKSV